MAAILPKQAEADALSSAVPLRRARLVDLIDSDRQRDLLRRESYLRCTQHDHKQFDFDGYLIRFSDAVDVPSSDYVPMKRRRPTSRMDLGKVITKRLTAMLFGHDKFPLIRVEGDADAEDFARQLAVESKLAIRLIEARDIGGSTGTSVLSWGFVAGRPVVEVHRSAFVEVLEWQDYEARRPGKVLKVYPYMRRVWDVEGKPRQKRFFYVRYWDDRIDAVWSAVPEDAANQRSWSMLPAKVVRHDLGSCPVYWIQNIPDSSSADGVSDYEGQEEGFDALDVLLSATQRGTVANVDPTLVIHDDPRENDGVVRRGSSFAIYARNGASYLELRGSALTSALELLHVMRQTELDKADVVLLDPEKISGGTVSAASMRMRYASMLAKCDTLREQYGAAIVNVLQNMLSAARRLPRGAAEPSGEGEGSWGVVTLAMRAEPRKDGGVDYVERTPGAAETVSLRWPPYFPATWQDRKEATETAKGATGGRPVLSQRTAVESLATLFDVVDVDRELEMIEEDAESGMIRTRRALDVGAPVVDLSANLPPTPDDNSDADDK